MNHDYTLDDLTPYAQRLFEQSYENRKRRQASREDCATGFIAGLIAACAVGLFKTGRYRE